MSVLQTSKNSSTNADREALKIWLMIVLTFATGVGDAVGYLGLDKVFVGNMTGNIVIIGMALAGSSGLPLFGPLIALAGFSAGAAGAGWVLRGPELRWTWRVSAILGASSLILITVSAAAWMFDGQLSPIQKNVFATAMAFEMGLQACVARRLAVRDMTTVVVTSTLVSFAGESLVGRPKGRVWNRRLAAVTAILAGALTGAALQHVHLGLAMAAASCLTIGMTVTGHLRWNGRSSGAQTD